MKPNASIKQKGENSMKKSLMIMLMLVLSVAFAFASGSSEKAAADGPSGKLVLYSTAADEEFETIVGGFMDKYPGIEVEAVQAGAGELKTRIKAEANNPQADVMAGLNYPDYLSMAENWEPYIPAINSELPENMQNNTDGLITWGTVQLVNLLVNKEEAAKLGVTITSYEDLLNPALKGKIISSNPASSFCYRPCCLWAFW